MESAHSSDNMNETKGLGKEEVNVSSNDVMNLRLIQREDDLYDKEPFHPIFTYQVFGDKEEIKGYTNLSINIYLTAASLRPYVNVIYSSKSKQADHILTPLKSLFKNGTLSL